MSGEQEQDRRERVIVSASSWIGTSYLHQASLKGVGCDCLGLLRGVWREVIGPEPGPVPPYRADWAAQGGCELLLEAALAHLMALDVAAARPGDVLLFRWKRHLPAMHCGILAAPDRLIHAHEGAAVAEVPLPGAWARRVSHAFAFPISEPQTEGGQG